MPSTDLQPLRARLARPGGALAPLLARAREVAAAEARVRAHLDPALAAHLRAVLLDDRRLVLIADAPAWAARARFAAPALGAALARAGLEVGAIRVVTRPPEPQRQAPPRPPLAVSPRSAALLRAVAAGIEDDDLRDRLLRLAERAREAR